MRNLLLSLTVLALSGAGLSRSLAQGEGSGQARSAEGDDIVRMLRNDDIWKEPAAKQELASALTFIQQHRIKAAYPLVAARISYNPAPAQPLLLSTGKSLSTFLPCYRVLVSGGVEAVPFLVNRLKELPPGKLDRQLLVSCLVEIYDQGGFGRELAVKRIQSEIIRSRDKEKRHLEDALKQPALN